MPLTGVSQSPCCCENLEYMKTAKHMNRLQVQWSLFFSHANFTTSYTPWIKNIKVNTLFFLYLSEDSIPATQTYPTFLTEIYKKNCQPSQGDLSISQLQFTPIHHICMKTMIKKLRRNISLSLGYHSQSNNPVVRNLWPVSRTWLFDKNHVDRQVSHYSPTYHH